MNNMIWKGELGYHQKRILGEITFNLKPEVKEYVKYEKQKKGNMFQVVGEI